MLQLVYSSVAVREFSRAELLDLLEVSRRNNFQLDITGMLLHRKGRFMQLLEGPEENVLRLYERIAADPRHAACRVLRRDTVDQRDFPDWKMGFEDLDDLDPGETPGLSDYLSRPFDDEFFAENAGAARLMLNLFKIRA